jgi:hypothetical protein
MKGIGGDRGREGRERGREKSGEEGREGGRGRTNVCIYLFLLILGPGKRQV